MYRDDLWYEKPLFAESLTRKTPRLQRLLDCICYTSHIADCEMDLLRPLITETARKQFVFAFGQKSAADHLATGLHASIQKQYDAEQQPWPPRLQEAHFELTKKISRLEKAFNE